jgi:phage shock protein C
LTRIYRSQRDKKIFGLCGGLAEAFNIDSTILRLVLIITAFFSGGTVIFLYIVASLVIPKEPLYDDRFDDYGFDDRYNGHYYNRRYHGPRHHRARYDSPYRGERDTIDEMMEDIEKKALRKEIEELREKLRKYEQNQEGDR